MDAPPGPAPCYLLPVLLLFLFWGPAQPAPCSNTYLTTHAGKVSVAEAMTNWDNVTRDWQKGYERHQLVTVRVTGAPCNGVLADWTMQLRAHSTDFAVFKQINLQHEFSFITEMFGDKPPKSIVDLGGNAGLTSLFMATQYPSARVVLVEPLVTNFLTAQMNTFHLENVFPEHAAIWGHVGYIEISGTNIWGAPLKDSNNEWAVTVKEVPAADKVAVTHVLPGITIPYLIQKYHFATIDFLKVDIEGAEVSLFAAENKPHLWLKYVLCLSIEIHNWAAGFPKDWKKNVFIPLMFGLEFSNYKDFGELSIWCQKGTGTAWRRQQ